MIVGGVQPADFVDSNIHVEYENDRADYFSYHIDVSRTGSIFEKNTQEPSTRKKVFTGSLQKVSTTNKARYTTTISTRLTGACTARAQAAAHQ